MAGFRGFVVRNRGADDRSPRSATGRKMENASLCIPSPADTIAAGDALPKALVDRIRREYFARAGGVAGRYGVLAEETLEHLRAANLAETPGPARALSFLEDLVTAVACVRGHPRAWQDLWERHESILLRACRLRLDDIDAVLATRRFWRELHAVTTLPEADRRGLADATSLPPSLVEYVGVRPLRVWLTDRLLAQVDRHGRRPARAACPNLDGIDSSAPVRMRLVD